MNLTEEQYAKIADHFPRHRGNVGLDNLSVLNAVLYVLENGCIVDAIYNGDKRV